MLREPEDCSRVATHWCQAPSLMGVVETSVVSGLPTPKAKELPHKAVPKSFVLALTNPSTSPRPCHHWPVPPVCVVFSQNETVKSLVTVLRTWTSFPVPLKFRQPFTWPLLDQAAPFTVPVLPLPDESFAVVPLVSSRVQ